MLDRSCDLEDHVTREYRYVQVDVFTDRVFGGNGLAVFLDGNGLTDAEMQSIAREMNQSESTFVMPPRDGDRGPRIRIFTPGQELPFAGHPTIGTAFVLAARGLLGSQGSTAVLEEEIGPIELALEGDEVTSPSFIWMQHRPATFADEVVDREAVARSLGLLESDLLDGAPVRVGSTGVPFLFVPLRDPSTVDRADTDFSALAAVGREDIPQQIFVFAPDNRGEGNKVYSRMFGAGLGITEDPATGGASGPLGAYLVLHGLVPAEEEVLILSEQGTKMGRQSFIHLRIGVSSGEVTKIEIGGTATPVLEGLLTLDG
jgi:trans-2,3-dihydro-3-hydroxyanthranilate isomerase